MIVAEEIAFIIIAIIFLVILAYKLIKNKDLIYLSVIGLSLVGVAIDIISMINKNSNIVLIIIRYILSVLIPVYVIISETRNNLFSYRIRIALAKLNAIGKNNKKAKKILHKLIEKYPNTVDAYLLLAGIYEDEGGSRKAIDQYVNILDIEPDNYDAYFRVAYLLNDLEKVDEAKQMLVSLHKKCPDHLDCTILLSNILIDQSNFKEAQAILLEGYKYNEASYDLLYNLGLVHTMLNDFTTAKQFYERAALINALNCVGRYNMAQIELICKNLDKAEEIFMELAQEEELSAESYLEVAKIYLTKNKKDMAINYANMAIEIDSKVIIPKIKKDSIFMPIIARLSMPFNYEEDDKIEPIFDKKELLVKKHLEEMQEITRQLSYTDLELISRKEEQKEEKQEKENNNISEQDENKEQQKQSLEQKDDQNLLFKGDENEDISNGQEIIGKHSYAHFKKLEQEQKDKETKEKDFEKISNYLPNKQDRINLKKSLKKDEEPEKYNSFSSIEIDKKLKNIEKNIEKNADKNTEYDNIYKSISTSSFNNTNIKDTKTKHPKNYFKSLFDKSKNDNQKYAQKDEIKNIENNNEQDKKSVVEQLYEQKYENSIEDITCDFVPVTDIKVAYSKFDDLTNNKDVIENTNFINDIKTSLNKTDYDQSLKDIKKKLDDEKSLSKNIQYVGKVIKEKENKDEKQDENNDEKLNIKLNDKLNYKLNEKQEESFFTKEEEALIDRYLSNIELKRTSKEEYKKYLANDKSKKHLKDIEKIENERKN